MSSQGIDNLRAYFEASMRTRYVCSLCYLPLTEWLIDATKESILHVCENEIDHVFLYSPDGGIDWDVTSFNRQEVAELKWVTIEELKKWVEKHGAEPSNKLFK